MSLMSTLAKAAIGIAVAKGASGMIKRSGSQSASQSGDTGLEGLLGSLTGGSTGQSAQGGGLEDMLGGLLGGSGASQAGGMPGGLGGLLEQLGSGASGGPNTGSGSLQDILGGLAGGGGGAGGLLSGLAGALGGASAAPQNNSSFGSVLNSSFDQTPETKIEPTPDQEAAAGLMLRAMIQAAKSDGKLDDAEREKLIGRLGDDISSDEANFVQAELNRPVDIAGLVSDTPNGLQRQMYAMSVLGINLDSQEEAQYLHKLASAYGMKPEQVNGIHTQMGVPLLYT